MIWNVVWVWCDAPTVMKLGRYAAASREALLDRFAEDGAMILSATEAK